MQRHPSYCTMFRASSVIGVCGVLATLALPVHAQGTNNGFTSLSDVSGPFLTNLHTELPPLVPPTNINVSITVLDNTNRDLLLSPELPSLGRVLQVCVHLSASMAKVAPFSGCSNVDWKAYNRAVKDAKELNRELTRVVQEQKTALAANPAPQERAAILQRLGLLEKTTSALESNAQALIILGEALDKAR